jgi:hypothetical protein
MIGRLGHYNGRDYNDNYRDVEHRFCAPTGRDFVVQVRNFKAMHGDSSRELFPDFQLSWFCHLSASQGCSSLLTEGAFRAMA